jgi:hypothetical protein
MLPPRWDCANAIEVQQRLLGFQRRYGQTAIPFDWRFTEPILASCCTGWMRTHSTPAWHDDHARAPLASTFALTWW